MLINLLWVQKSFPFEQKFQLEFLKISCVERNSISVISGDFGLENIVARYNHIFRKFLTRNFSSICVLFFSFGSFRNFGLTGSHLLSIFFKEISTEFSFSWPLFRKFRNFWLNRKRPKFLPTANECASDRARNFGGKKRCSHVCANHTYFGAKIATWTENDRLRHNIEAKKLGKREIKRVVVLISSRSIYLKSSSPHSYLDSILRLPSRTP